MATWHVQCQQVMTDYTDRIYNRKSRNKFNSTLSSVITFMIIILGGIAGRLKDCVIHTPLNGSVKHANAVIRAAAVTDHGDRLIKLNFTKQTVIEMENKQRALVMQNFDHFSLFRCIVLHVILTCLNSWFIFAF